MESPTCKALASTQTSNPRPINAFARSRAMWLASLVQERKILGAAIVTKHPSLASSARTAAVHIWNDFGQLERLWRYVVESLLPPVWGSQGRDQPAWPSLPRIALSFVETRPFGAAWQRRSRADDGRGSGSAARAGAAGRRPEPTTGDRETPGLGYLPVLGQQERPSQPRDPPRRSGATAVRRTIARTTICPS